MNFQPVTFNPAKGRATKPGTALLEAFDENGKQVGVLLVEVFGHDVAYSFRSGDLIEKSTGKVDNETFSRDVLSGVSAVLFPFGYKVRIPA